MKAKTLTNIFAVFLSLIILAVGNGVNLIEYCCSQCESQGVEVLLSVSCEDIHHNHNHDESHSCCTSSSVDFSDDHKCQLTRYDLDDVSELQAKSSLHLTVLAVIHHHCGLVITSQQTAFFSTENYSSDGYIPDTGRAILANKCVLTI